MNSGSCSQRVGPSQLREDRVGDAWKTSSRIHRQTRLLPAIIAGDATTVELAGQEENGEGCSIYPASGK